MNGISFHPVLPWPWLLLLGTALAAALTWSFFRGVRTRGGLYFMLPVRLVCLGGLLFLLLQPQRQAESATALRPRLAVLVDASSSMGETLDPGQPSRADRVRQWLATSGIKEANNDFDISFFHFDRALSDATENAAELRFDGNASNLLGALNQVQERFRGQPLAGILVLSDGLDTSGRPLPAGTQAGVPIDTFELEQPFQPKERPKHLAISAVDFPPRVVSGWNANIRVDVTGNGLAGQSAGVELWRENDKVAEVPVAFNSEEQTRQVVFPVTHSLPGTVKYEVRLSHPAADKETSKRPFVIEVLEPGNRVLYIQNTLGFDFKFLRKAIRADRNLQMSSYARWGDGRIVSLDDAANAAGKPLAVTADALSQNAVVIVGDLPAAALSTESWGAIRNFVDRGGGLVLLGGPNLFGTGGIAATPLRDLLPFPVPAPLQEGSFGLEITNEGMHHPVFGPLFTEVKAFPPLLTCNVANSVAPNSEVLMQTLIDGAPHPVVVSMRFGQGRVVSVLSDTIWRWRLAAKGWSSDRSPYDTFWAQLMDWLVPKEQERQSTGRIELFTERTSYLLGEKPEVRAILHTEGKKPASLPVELQTPDGKVFNYTLRPTQLRTPAGKAIDGYRAEVDPNVPGVFTARTSSVVDGTKLQAELRFVVTQAVTEKKGSPIDREFLRQLSETNGGKFYPVERWKEWRQDLKVEQQYLSHSELIDLWTNPWIAGALLALLATEWIGRKVQRLP